MTTTPCANMPARTLPQLAALLASAVTVAQRVPADARPADLTDEALAGLHEALDAGLVGAPTLVIHQEGGVIHDVVSAVPGARVVFLDEDLSDTDPENATPCPALAAPDATQPRYVMEWGGPRFGDGGYHRQITVAPTYVADIAAVADRVGERLAQAAE